MLGLDCSHWSGTLEWPNIKQAGYDFAFLKATESKNYMPPEGKDELFPQHVWGAAQEDIVWAPYHFWRFYGVEGPEGQIDKFLEYAWSEGPPTCKYVILDIEDKAAPKLTLETRKRIGRSLSHLKRNLPGGYIPMIYTAAWWWDPWVWNDDVTLDTGERVYFAQSPLWVAHYTYNYLKKPLLPKTCWTDFLVHQYSDRGFIPGAGDDTIDLNWFGGTVEDMKVSGSKTIEERLTDLEARVTILEQR